MNGYELTRQWWDFAYNSGKDVKPEHHAVYLYSVELCNRLGWKQRFGIPTTVAMEAVGIRSYKTYIKVFKDLCEWGLFELLEKSTNQYSANVIALVIFTEAQSKALDKALLNHTPKQVQSTDQSTYSIIKQETINHKPQTDAVGKRFVPPTLEQCIEYAAKRGYNQQFAEKFYDTQLTTGWLVGKAKTPMRSWEAAMRTWEKESWNDRFKIEQTTTNRRVLAENFDPLNT